MRQTMLAIMGLLMSHRGRMEIGQRGPPAVPPAELAEELNLEPVTILPPLLHLLENHVLDPQANHAIRV